jgi:TolB-like protein/DNA-binding winged helix-turn-helix (wHTH) protein
MNALNTNLIYRFQGFVLDERNRRLSNSAGHDVKLSSRAFDTLVELVHHRGETLSKDQLMHTVWKGLVVEENNINQAICLVRKALGDSMGEPVFVKTVSGKGFCFVADVDTSDEVESDLAVDELTTLASSDAGATPAPANTLSIHDSASQRSWHFWLRPGSVAAALALALTLFFLNTQKMGDVTEANIAESQNFATANAEDPSIIPDSIAVMPFTNLNESADSELFVLGLHDELINQLAKVESLKVIARDSIISVAQKGDSLSEIADSLNVESLLTGSILVVGERARINLQMLNAGTGVALWSTSFEVDTQSMSDMLSAQGDIALKVVKALEVEVKLPEAESLAKLPTQSFNAHRYYLTARNSYNHQDEAAKWVLISKALEADPDYADAHLMFATINALLAATPMQGYTNAEHLRLALASADNYIRLEPQRSEGYASKALVLGAKGDWQGVHEQLAMLHHLDASAAEMKYVALVQMALGDFQGAIHIYEASLLTEPANLYSRGLLMAAHEIAGDQQRARQEYALGNELKSEWWGRTVNVLLALGRKAPLDTPDTLVDFSAELRHVLTNLHDPEQVRHGVANYMASGAQNAKEDIFYSALAAYSGDTNAANALLRTSTEKVSTSIFWVWLPVFADLRRTEAFKQLLVDVGLIDYWQQHGWPPMCQPHAGAFRCD